MSKESLDQIQINTEQIKKNPNTIGELLSIGKDLPTVPDKVYRSVKGRDAIDDLNNSGVVRNKQTAGLVEKSRWGERVFWSRGALGKYHAISQNTYVIEAPLSVAEERVVTREDVTAIYQKDSLGSVINLLEQSLSLLEQTRVCPEHRDREKLIEVKKSLGLSETV